MIHLTQPEYESLMAAKRERDRLREVLQNQERCQVRDLIALPMIAGLLVITAILDRFELMPRVRPVQRTEGRRS